MNTGVIVRCCARVFAAAVVVFASTVAAWAQDYTVTQVSGKYEAPPANATELTTLRNNSANAVAPVTAPFAIPFYGRQYCNAAGPGPLPVWMKNPKDPYDTSARYTGGYSLQYLLLSDNGYVACSPRETGWSGLSATNAAIGSGSSTLGYIAPAWDDFNPTGGSGGRVVHWTAGTAPSRRWIVCWENVPHASGSGSASFEVKFYETSGRIVFAYGGGGDWTPFSYSAGLEALQDARFTAAGTTSSTRAGPPGTDYQFDPDVTTVTGRILMDLPVTDTSSVGATTDSDIPTAGFLVEVRSASDTPSAGFWGRTDVDGYFQVDVLAGNDGATAKLSLWSETAACWATTPTDAGEALNTCLDSSLDLATGVSLSGAALGTLRITDTNDADLTFRGQLNVARTVQSMSDWVAQHAGVTPAPLVVLNAGYYYNVLNDWSHPTAGAESGPHYQGFQSDLEGTAIRPMMRVQGYVPVHIAFTGSAYWAVSRYDAECWYPDEIALWYADHVFGALTGAYCTAQPNNIYAPGTWDLAEAFRCWFASAVGGGKRKLVLWSDEDVTTITYDPGTGLPIRYDHFITPHPIEFDLEDGSASVDIGTYFASSGFGARDFPPLTPLSRVLYDLIDGANEKWDKVDGTGDPDALLDVIKGVKPLRRYIDAGWSVYAGHSALTLPDFCQRWAAASHDGLALARLIVHAGEDSGTTAKTYDDYTDEAFDYGTETTACFAAPTSPISLYVSDESLATFDVEGDAPGLRVGIMGPTLAIDGQEAAAAVSGTVDVEVLRPDGTRAVSGTLTIRGDDSVDPRTKYRYVTTGPVEAGRYTIHLRHVGGRELTGGELEIYTLVEGRTVPSFEWTRDRPAVVPVVFRGGWGMSDLSPRGLPAGLSFDGRGVPLQIQGTPTEAGEWSWYLHFEGGTWDYVSPGVDTLPGTIRINPPLALSASRWNCVPVGRNAVVSFAREGGTAPYAFAVGQGTLPDGLSLDGGAPTVTGTMGAAGSAHVRLDGVDDAGSAASTETTIVGCAALEDVAVDVDLGGGAAATGVFVDAVANSKLTISVTTAKKRPKRALSVLLLASDGSEVEAAVKAKPGSTRARGGGSTTRLKPGKASVTAAIPATDRYFLVVFSDVGDASTLHVTRKLTVPTAGKGWEDAFAEGDRHVVEIPTYAGASLQFVGRFDKKKGASFGIESLTAPDGTVVPLDGLVKESKTGVTLKAKPGVSGVWTIVLVGRAGGEGRLSYSYTLKAPKSAPLFLDDDGN